MAVRGPRKYVCFTHRYYRKARTSPTAFFGSGNASVVPKCPVCRKEMINIGQFNKIPKRNNIKAWDKLYKGLKC